MKRERRENGSDRRTRWVLVLLSCGLGCVLPWTPFPTASAWAAVPEGAPQYVHPVTRELIHPGVLPSKTLVDLLAFVSSPEGRPLEVLIASVDGEHQLTEESSDGTFRFEASSANFVGEARVTFAVSEEGGDAATFVLVLGIGTETSPPPPPPPPPATPTPPSQLSATMRQGPLRVELTWMDNSDDEDGFRIYRGLAGQALSELGTATGVTFTDTTVVAGTTYDYEVTAFNGAGESEASNRERITVATTEPRFNTLPILRRFSSTVIQAEEDDLGAAPLGRRHYAVKTESNPTSRWITLRVASRTASQVHFELDGAAITGMIAVPATGCEACFTLLSTQLSTSIAAGNNRLLALVIDSGDPKVDWFRFDDQLLASDDFSGLDGAALEGRQLPTGPHVWDEFTGSFRLAEGKLGHGTNRIHVAGIREAVTAPTPEDAPFWDWKRYTVQVEVDPTGSSWVELGFVRDLEQPFAGKPQVSLRLFPSGVFQLLLQESVVAQGGVQLRGGVAATETLNELRVEYGRNNSQQEHFVSAWINGVKVVHDLDVTAVIDVSAIYLRARMPGEGAVDVTTFDNFAVFKNKEPTAAPPLGVSEWDVFDVDEDSFAEVEVLANDRLPLEATHDLSPVVELEPLNGSATVLAGTHRIRYTPNQDFFGFDHFFYNARSEVFAANGSANRIGGIAIAGGEILSVNDPPTARKDSYSVPEDGGVRQLAVLANDTIEPDAGESLSVVGVTAPASGSAVVAPGGGWVEYVPAADFAGIETFTYAISDGNGGSASAAVTVTVTPVNDPPVASPDFVTVAEDSATTIVPVLANDTTGPDSGETLSVLAVTEPSAGGRAVVTPGGASVEYAPAPDFSGKESFAYTVADSNGGTASATVMVDVTAVNDLPVLESSLVCEGRVCAFAATAFDVEDGQVGVTWTFGDGSTRSSATGEHWFDADGVYDVSVKAGDSQGGEAVALYSEIRAEGLSIEEMVQVLWSGRRGLPVAKDDAANVAAGSTQRLDVLANDRSTLGAGGLRIVQVSQSAVGSSVAIVENVLEYRPAVGFSGTESLLYTVADGQGNQDSASVSIAVK